MNQPLRSDDRRENKFEAKLMRKLARSKFAQSKFAREKLAKTDFGKRAFAQYGTPFGAEHGFGDSGSAKAATADGARMDEDAVKNAYRRWAPVYDHTFGRVAAEGRKHSVEIINLRQGRVLEVGVGTGLSLPTYGRHLDIVGIDLSPEMLEKARERVSEEGLSHVTGLHEMDASNLGFPDASFDTTVAMYVMTVVPDPEKVMRELSRVTKPGGEVILVNHFSQEEGVRGWVERKMAPFADKLGWHPIFDFDRVLVCDDLRQIERRALRPMGLFTMMRFAKLAGPAVPTRH